MSRFSFEVTVHHKAFREGRGKVIVHRGDRRERGGRLPYLRIFHDFSE